MKIIAIFTAILISLLSFSFLTTRDNQLEEKEYARLSMSYYGFFQCIVNSYEYLNSKELSKIEHDLMLAANRYSMFNRGMYSIEQNEETLENIYDPYKETKDFITALSYDNLEKKKLDKNFNPILRCLYAFESREYKKFIHSLDHYIDISSINDQEYLDHNSLIK